MAPPLTRAQKDRANQLKRERYASDPEMRRKMLSTRYKDRYGITLDEKDALLAAQGGVCANPGCGATESGGHGWHVDHDHACCPTPSKSCGDCIRGILCHSCNLALGHLKDDIARLQGLIEYLMLAGMSPGGSPNMQASVSRMIPT